MHTDQLYCMNAYLHTELSSYSLLPTSFLAGSEVACVQLGLIEFVELIILVGFRESLDLESIYWVCVVFKRGCGI